MSLHDFDRLQERLKSVEDPVAFLVNLFAHAPVGFGVWNAEGQALLTNQAFMDLFHAEPPPEYNVLKDDVLAATGMLALFQRAFAGETVRVPTFWYDPRDLKIIDVTEGRRVAISMTIFPLFKRTGEIDYVAATYKDETEIMLAQENADRLVRERTAELEAANRQLEAFSYSVAHDLRAPLRGMDGFARILLEDYANKLDADGIDCLRRIHANAVLMGQLIDALLGLSRVSRGALHPAEVDLSTLARVVAGQLASAEPHRTVEVAVAEGLRARIDPTLARTLLENLLANARKFTRDAAAPRVEIGTIARASDTGDPTYFVRDNGAGFDMAHVSKLFTPFQRLHTVREFPGTGVGLATCYRIVDRHGGKMWAEGAVGQGATFYFTLPDPEGNP